MNTMISPAKTFRLSVAAALMLASTSGMALSRNLNGGDADPNNDEATVIPGDSPETWGLWDNATLNVNGGTTLTIESHYISTVNASGATVNGGLILRNGSVANISGSTIYNTATGPLSAGLIMANQLSGPGGNLPSTANVTNSSISGLGFGASIIDDGILNLSGSQLIGRDDGGVQPYNGGFGLRLFDGTVNIQDGSYVAGNNGGILLFPNASRPGQQRNVTIDGSTVEGLTGGAIQVRGYVASGNEHRSSGDIVVRNGSTLIGANGNILEVDRLSDATFTVDNSALEGNVVVEDGGSANVTLQNNASLKGALTGVGNLTAASGGTWKMVGDGGVTNLMMNGGAVEISDGSGFNTLTVENLSGAGTFVMGTDIGAALGDRLVVTGDAAGDHTLHVKNTGVEPTSEHELMVVDTNGGDASFALLGAARAVDLGVYKHYLEQRGDDWFLVGSGDPGDPGDPGNPGDGDLTPGAETTIGLHAAAANVYYGELGTLRQRMGDLRLSQGGGQWGSEASGGTGGGETGLWGRTYGRQLKGRAAHGVGFDQSLGGLAVGADQEFAIGGQEVLFGAFAGYSSSTIDIAGGSEGDLDSYYGGLYATWLSGDGLYVDGLFKVNRFSNDARVVMSDGSPASGGYDATGVGGQIEIGRTLDLGRGFYAEPFAQLAALHVGSFSYGLDNGMAVDGDAVSSVVGRIGATVGFTHQLEGGGLIQPYLRAAVANEFAQGDTLALNGIGFDNSQKGIRGEIGAGLIWQVDDRFQLHADVDYSDGKHVEQNFGGNLSLRYAF